MADTYVGMSDEAFLALDTPNDIPVLVTDNQDSNENAIEPEPEADVNLKLEATPEVNEPVEPEAEAKDDLESNTSDNDENTIKDTTENTTTTTNDEKLSPLIVNLNGVDIEVKEDEVSKLVEVGLESQQYKTQINEFKPFMEVLQNEGLVEDTDMLDLLVEAKNGNVNALKQLMQINDIDPLSLTDTKDVDTKTIKSHVRDSKEIYLGEVIDSLKELPEFAMVSKSIQTFDDASKAKITEDPDMLRMLTDDAKSGKYAQTMAEVSKRLSLGTLDKSLPKVEQYSTIYLELFAEETKNVKPTANTSKKTPPVGVMKSKKKVVEPVAKSQQTLSFAGMSDADFLKLDSSNY